MTVDPAPYGVAQLSIPPKVVVAERLRWAILALDFEGSRKAMTTCESPMLPGSTAAVPLFALSGATFSPIEHFQPNCER